MFVVMTVLTVLKVPFEKAAPPCPSYVPAPLPTIDLNFFLNINKFYFTEDQIKINLTKLKFFLVVMAIHVCLSAFGQTNKQQ